MIKPLGKNVLLQELPPPDRSAGGITIPLTALQPQFYRVLAFGGKVEAPLREGDKVMLDQYTLDKRDGAGRGLWLVPEQALAFVIAS